MGASLTSLFAPAGFEPHGQCLLWNADLVWLHVVSDTVIALSYYSIPLALLSFVRKKRDVPFHWMFLMFGAFILACGTTHVMSIWTMWRPLYWLDGAVKVATACVSFLTAWLLWPLIPKALALPSPAQLETANRALQQEISEHRRTERELARRVEELSRSNDDLERFNRSAVGREQRMIELKRQVNRLLHDVGKPPAYNLSFVSEERSAQ